MKLASIKDGTRDGRLVVVSTDLSCYAAVPDIAATLQAALDDWEQTAPRLTERAVDLAAGKVTSEPFDESKVHSPLPRAYQWADGSAYVNHVELVRRARGADVPDSFYTDPLMYQGGSDAFLDPRGAIPQGDPAWGCDMEGEVAVITGDVPMGVGPEQAERSIRLVMLCNDVSLRGLIPAELAKGFGFFQSKPSTAFSPVAVTPDELGAAWRDGLVHLPLRVDLNGEAFGRAECGEDATFSLPELIAHAAKTRSLTAGSIIGSGTVSNRGADGGPGRSISRGGRGYSCIAEVRMIETIERGAAQTEFLKEGDRVRIEMLDRRGDSVFGAIDQPVRRV